MEYKINRDFGYDNIKFFLILFVIVGHLLEFCKVPGWQELYKFIYIFHMPAFVFLSGVFAGKNTAKGIFREFVIYMVFQTAYIAFSNHFLGTASSYQYTTPYWLLWFSLAMLFYHILTPLFDTGKPWQIIAAIGITVALSLFSGYDTTIGYYSSLSRFLVFQPYYVLGLYFGKARPRIQRFLDEKKIRGILISLFSAVSAAFTFLIVFDKRVTSTMLYGSYSYAKLNYGVLTRLILLLAGLAWISFFLFVLKPILTRKIFLITMVGANTLPVFLMHGFVIKLLNKYHTASFDSYLFILLVAAVILLVFGNPIFSAVFYFRLPKRNRNEVAEKK